MKRAIYPGSFDPWTNGHLDILRRALSVFDEVIIVVAGTNRKNPLFSPEERVSIISDVVKAEGLERVQVDYWSGLIMDYAKKHEAQFILRGLRAASDFEYEFMMASMNKEILSEIETVFMMTSKNLFFVSSSMVKELYRYGGKIDSYVPKVVVQYLKSKIESKSKED